MHQHEPNFTRAQQTPLGLKDPPLEPTLRLRFESITRPSSHTPPYPSAFSSVSNLSSSRRRLPRLRAWYKSQIRQALYQPHPLEA